jgi:transposase-like protein
MRFRRGHPISNERVSFLFGVGMNLFKIVCRCPRKGNNKIPHYIGDIRTDIAVSGEYHCKVCGQDYEVISDGNGRIYRRAIPRVKMAQVHCEDCEKKYKVCFYLGKIQIDIPNLAHYYCKHCNRTFEVTVDIDRNVSMKPVQGLIQYSENLTVIGD